MDDGTRFLILSLEGENYALSVARLVEITVPRNIQRDAKLGGMYEGKFEYRGSLIPVLNIKKVFKLSGTPGATLLVVKSGKGLVGLLVDTVTEVLETGEQPVPMPQGVVDPGHQYYGGVLRHKENLVLLLNEDGLLP
jgi:purine-binding chemotaxis protein CheW